MTNHDAAPNNPKATLPRVVKFQVLLAILATAITVALAAYMPALISRRSQLESDIQNLQQQKTSLLQQTQSLQAQRDATTSAYHALANNTAASLTPEKAQQAIEESLSNNPEAAKILPRVFIHIRSASQRAKAAEIATTLRSQGYIVPGVQILVDQGPTETQVRYFHDADKDEAAKIAATLTASGVADPQTEYVSHYPNVRSRQYEIWFSPAAP
jgi:hypothetical protein